MEKANLRPTQALIISSFALSNKKTMTTKEISKWTNLKKMDIICSGNCLIDRNLLKKEVKIIKEPVPNFPGRVNTEAHWTLIPKRQAKIREMTEKAIKYLESL